MSANSKRIGILMFIKIALTVNLHFDFTASKAAARGKEQLDYVKGKSYTIIIFIIIYTLVIH